MLPGFSVFPRAEQQVVEPGLLLFSSLQLG